MDSSLLIYIDDMIFFCNNSYFLTTIISNCKRKFMVKDLGTLDYFLNIEATHTALGILLTQNKDIVDLLH